MGLISWLWRQWLVILVGWFSCAVWVVVAIKHEKHKALLSVYANGVVATLLVAPFALSNDAVYSRDGSCGSRASLWQRIWHSLLPLRQNFRLVLLISMLSGLERNLTNAALYSIGGSLKTALHGLNVIMVFFSGALVAGVDDRARKCLFRCCWICRNHDSRSGSTPALPERTITDGQYLVNHHVDDRGSHRECCRSSNILMGPVLLLVGGGGLVTALSGNKSNWKGDFVGVSLQLSSGVAYAMKHVLIKVLLTGLWQSSDPLPDVEISGRELSSPDPYRDRPSDDRGSLGMNRGSSSDVEGCRSEISGRNKKLIPSKTQIALITNPITGILALGFLPIFENSDWTSPSLSVVLSFAIGVTGILIFELQLVQLTSPLTLAVLNSVHNVVIVLFFVLKDGEVMSPEQAYGFMVSTLGVIGYAVVRRLQIQEDQQETQFPVVDGGSQSCRGVTKCAQLYRDNVAAVCDCKTGSFSSFIYRLFFRKYHVSKRSDIDV